MRKDIRTARKRITTDKIYLPSPSANKLPRYWDNNAFTDNLTLYGNDAILKGPWVDVRSQPGWAADNVTDSTVAFLSAVTAANGGTVVFGYPGTASNTYVIDNATVSIAGTHIIIPAGVTVRTKANATLNGWTIKLAAANCRISGYGTIDGNKSGGSGENYYVVRVEDADDVVIENITIKNTPSAAIYAERSRRGRISNATIINPNYYGIFLWNDPAATVLTDDWLIENPKIIKTDSQGAPMGVGAILGYGGSASNRMKGLRVINPHIDFSALTDNSWAATPTTALGGISCRFCEGTILSNPYVSAGYDMYMITELGAGAVVTNPMLQGNNLAMIGIELAAGYGFGANVVGGYIRNLKPTSSDGILISDDIGGNYSVTGTMIDNARIGVRVLSTAGNNTFEGVKIRNSNLYGTYLLSSGNKWSGGHIHGTATSQNGVFNAADNNTIQGVEFTGDYSTGAIEIGALIYKPYYLNNVFRQTSGSNIAGQQGDNVAYAGVYQGNVPGGSPNYQYVEEWSTAPNVLNARDSIQDIDTTSGNLIVTLYYTKEYKGQLFTFKKISSDNNTVTVTPKAGETIDGAATYVLSKQFDTVEIYSAGGTNWYIKSKIVMP